MNGKQIWHSSSMWYITETPLIKLPLSHFIHANTRTTRQIIKGRSRLVHWTTDYSPIMEADCYVWEKFSRRKRASYSWHLCWEEWQNWMCGKTDRTVISKYIISLAKEHYSEMSWTQKFPPFKSLKEHYSVFNNWNSVRGNHVKFANMTFRINSQEKIIFS